MPDSAPENMLDITGQAVAAITTDEKVLRLFYQDLAQPGVRQVGKALSTVLGLGNTILLPLKMANAKANALYSEHMNNYKEKLRSYTDDKIVEVAPEIGVPILENLEKTTNKTISEMYLNLLANASHIDYAGQAHPRFVSIIESLTHDEVIILNAAKTSILFISVDSYTSFSHTGVTQQGVTRIVDKVTKFHKPSLLTLPERAEFYFDNLKRLGLIEEPERSPVFKIFGDPYAELKKEYEASIIPRSMNNDRREVIEGLYNTTPFCRLFLKACASSE